MQSLLLSQASPARRVPPVTQTPTLFVQSTKQVWPLGHIPATAGSQPTKVTFPSGAPASDVAHPAVGTRATMVFATPPLLMGTATCVPLAVQKPPANAVTATSTLPDLSGVKDSEKV